MKNFKESMLEPKNRIKNLDQIAGKNGYYPFNTLNSGSRKIMAAAQNSQKMVLEKAEVPKVAPHGNMKEAGRLSSSYEVYDNDYTVVSKIPLFLNTDIPMNHYYVLLKNLITNELRMIERTDYKHITEEYGYRYNNSYLDDLDIGQTVYKGSIIRTSTSFEDNGLRKDGVNLLTCYVATLDTTEDGIRLSEPAQNKMGSPTFHEVVITLNENDMPLNIYGKDGEYKVVPDLYEYVNDDGILMGTRRENKNEILYSQSDRNLKTLMMSDDKYSIKGQVVDINVSCNNIEFISTNPYYQQIYGYYLEQRRFAQTVVDTINDLVLREGCSLEYEAQKVYYNSKDLLEGKQYINEKKFSNAVIKITVMERNGLKIGDKICNRYGGKGVVSSILPAEMMPMLPNGQRAELIFNINTMPNRENYGQTDEMSINHVATSLVHFIVDNNLDIYLSFEMIIKFYKIINPEQAEFISKTLEKIHDDFDEMMCLFNSIVVDDGLIVSLKPITGSPTIDILAELYEAFPFAKPQRAFVPMKGSDGSIRMVQTNRPLLIAYQYIHRLKQRAEEKFSATSLSAINIKSANSRSKNAKNFKSTISKTPVKFGEMEIGNLLHTGIGVTMKLIMEYIASQNARLRAKNLATGDPYNFDIKVNDNDKNRNAETINCYFKVIGIRILFQKIKKKIINPIATILPPMQFGYHIQNRSPIIPIGKGEVYDPRSLPKEINRRRVPIVSQPIEYIYEEDQKYLLSTEAMNRQKEKEEYEEIES